MDTAETVTPPLVALHCWIQGRRIYLRISDRRCVSFPASKYGSLALASQSDLEKIQLLNAGRTIKWETLDEEIAVEDVLNNHFVHTPRAAVQAG
jgi:hypothetical protein